MVRLAGPAVGHKPYRTPPVCVDAGTGRCARTEAGGPRPGKEGKRQ